MPRTIPLGGTKKGKWWAVDKDLVRWGSQYRYTPLYHKVKDQQYTAPGDTPAYFSTECGLSGGDGLLIVEYDFRNFHPGEDCIECWQGRLLRNMRIRSRSIRSGGSAAASAGAKQAQDP